MTAPGECSTVSSELPATVALGAVLEGRALSRRHRDGERSVIALDHVSLALHAGERVLVTGPSGSGKTSLLHLLATLDTPDSGEVLIDGRATSALSRAARADLRLARLGLVFAEHNLSPALRVDENVDLPLAWRGVSAGERRARVQAALERVGAAAFAHRFPDALSSGERQRVALARALAGDPAALLADEPTAHLDSASSRELGALLRDVAEERGMAVLVATHDPLLEEFAQRVLRLDDGALVRGETRA
ncbi:MAG: macrolide ABC transporter ATP-binding protein [Planctomycetota bacterium]|nr:MAG: macrolide ABC transporter ATP-binding protein [Planctomycetota bacterium]